MEKKIILKRPSKKAEKLFNEGARMFTPFSFEATALQFEIRQHFPYRVTINFPSNTIYFHNRDYQPIGSIEIQNKEEIREYKFDSKRFDLNKFDWLNMEKGSGSCTFYLYYDGNKPWLTQQNFIDYMNKLNYLESLMREVSPFIKRYILIVNRAYDLAKQLN